MNSAKFTFYYMLSFVTLFIISLSTGTIIFEIIDKIFPNITENVYSSESSLKGAISGILIGAPVFYFVMHKIYANLRIKEFNKDSEIRKWLTYLILFISSVVVIGSLIGVFNNFLEGAITMNFILKALTVLLIAFLIFGFYFIDIKRNDFESKKINNIFFLISLTLILAVFVISFFIIESPFEARNRKIDEKNIHNFEMIKNNINRYYEENNKLPNNLKELENEGEFVLVNSITKKPYNYEIIGEEEYKLCTDFLISNMDSQRNYYDKTWKHDIGYDCVIKKIRKFLN